MAKNRFINTKFWSDGFIVSLDIAHRYLFLYFLTNAHTHICGIYELPLSVMAFETKIKEADLVKMIKKFKGKIYYIDGWVYLKNFAKHQTESEKIKKGIENGLAAVPKPILQKIYTIDTLYVRHEVFESELESKHKPELESKAAQAPKGAKDAGSKIHTKGMEDMSSIIKRLYPDLQ